MPVFFDISTTFLEMNNVVLILRVPPPTGTPSEQTPQKSIFLLPQARALVFFFNISPYLRDECFDIIWNPPPPWTPPKWTLQILIFCLAQTRAPVLFFIINRYNRQIFRHSLRVPTPQPKWTPKNQVFARPNLRCLYF